MRNQKSKSTLSPEHQRLLAGLLWRQQLLMFGLRVIVMMIGIVLRAGDWLHKTLHHTNLLVLLIGSY